MPEGGEATARPEFTFTELAGVPVHYDRYDDVRFAYGTQGRPRKERATPAFAERLEAAFQELWERCPRGRAQLIVTAGCWDDREGLHGAGRAFDLDGIFWPDGRRFLGVSYPTEPLFYLGVEAVLRRHFGTVTGYLCDPAHRDHLHLDDGRAVGFDPGVRSTVVFVQCALAHLFGSHVEVTGRFDDTVARALLRFQQELRVEGDMAREEVWRRFLTAVARRAFARAQLPGHSGRHERVVPSMRNVRALRDHDPCTTAFIEAHRARLRRKRKVPHVEQFWVPSAMISPLFKCAVVQAEDKNFLRHRGFDFEAIRRVVRRTLRERQAVGGASTISQQLAKNLWLSPTRSVWRKLVEAVLTLELEAFLGKERILEIYSNVVELGQGVYGVEAAARRYYGKAAIDLDLTESVHLAAALPRPRTWHPGCGDPAYEARAARIASDFEVRRRKGHFIDLGVS